MPSSNNTSVVIKMAHMNTLCCTMQQGTYYLLQHYAAQYAVCDNQKDNLYEPYMYIQYIQLCIYSMYNSSEFFSLHMLFAFVVVQYLSKYLPQSCCSTLMFDAPGGVFPCIQTRKCQSRDYCIFTVTGLQFKSDIFDLVPYKSVSSSRHFRCLCTQNAKLFSNG